MNYQILTPLIPFTLGILLKTLLDFNLAKIIVKRLYWIPVRSIFRMKVHNISGIWEQVWENETSEKYSHKNTRKSKVEIKQFGKYCYGEFRSANDEEYYIFGEITDRYIIGKWSDCNTDLGYYGSFEFRIVDQNNLNGIWLGHSNNAPDQINTNIWNWTR